MNPLELYEKDEFDAAKLESIFFFFSLFVRLLQASNRIEIVDSR